MRNLGIKKLTKEAFAKYGTYGSIVNPDGNPLSAKKEDIITFYPDMVQQGLGNSTTVSFSACIVKQRPWIIENTEYHDHCCETILITGGDYLMHVATARGKDEMPFEDFEVFLVPEGTVINVRPGVWHQAGFPYHCDQVNILCALPERTYANDCVFVQVPEEKRVQVVDEFID